MQCSGSLTSKSVKITQRSCYRLLGPTTGGSGSAGLGWSLGMSHKLTSGTAAASWWSELKNPSSSGVTDSPLKSPGKY